MEGWLTPYLSLSVQFKLRRALRWVWDFRVDLQGPIRQIREL